MKSDRCEKMEMFHSRADEHEGADPRSGGTLEEPGQEPPVVQRMFIHSLNYCSAHGSDEDDGMHQRASNSLILPSADSPGCT